MTIDVTVPHKLGVQEAVKRIKHAGDGKLPDGVTMVRETWTDAKNQADIDCQVASHDVHVTIAVAASQVRLTTSDLPWYFGPFAWAAKSKIKQQLQQVLS